MKKIIMTRSMVGDMIESKMKELKELEIKICKLQDEADALKELYLKHEDYYVRYNRKNQLDIADDLRAEWEKLDDEIDELEVVKRHLKNNIV